MKKGQRFGHFGSTISLKHQILPIVGASLSGTKDPSFHWALTFGKGYEASYLSSSGIRHDADRIRMTGVFCNRGEIDSIPTDRKNLSQLAAQRPALYIFNNGYSK